MRVVTLISDFGNESISLAKIKGFFLSKEENISVISINNNIPAFDIEKGAYILNSCFDSFPSYSVHIFGIDNILSSKKFNPQTSLHSHFIIAKVRNHYFIGPNNGFIGLINNGDIDKIIKVKYEIPNSKFPTLEEYCPAAYNILKGINLESLGMVEDLAVKLKRKEIRQTPTQLVCNIDYIDNYGNLITNLSKDIFKEWNKSGQYTIYIGREKFNDIHLKYSDVELGDCFCLFNSEDLFEVGINQGNASKLLGLRKDSSISFLK